jgi:hypothetical protein
MNCEQWEWEIAEGAGGEALRTHLESCADCRAAAAEFEANREALRDIEVDAAAFDTVRGRVLDRIRAKRRAAAWGWAVGIAACIALAWATVAALRFGYSAAPAPPPVLAEMPRPAPVFASAPNLAPVHARRAKRPRPGGPLVVKMLTNDPNVVIIWITD